MVPGVVGLGLTAWPKGSQVQDGRPYSHSLLTKRSSTRLCFCRDLGTGPGCAPPSVGDRAETESKQAVPMGPAAL